VALAPLAVRRRTQAAGAGQQPGAWAPRSPRTSAGSLAAAASASCSHLPCWATLGPQQPLSVEVVARGVREGGERASEASPSRTAFRADCFRVGLNNAALSGVRAGAVDMAGGAVAVQWASHPLGLLSRPKGTTRAGAGYQNHHETAASGGADLRRVAGSVLATRVSSSRRDDVSRRKECCRTRCGAP
jgi:hypothetical protein